MINLPYSGLVMNNKEFSMKNAKFLLAALAIALLFGLASCGNKDKTDTALNGTWVSGEKVLKLNNGSYEYSGYSKGTYTTSGTTITMTLTHYWGGDLNEELFEEKWYTKAELLNLIPEEANNVNEMFKPQKGTYSVSGNTLTISYESGYTSTFTK